MSAHGRAKTLDDGGCRRDAGGGVNVVIDALDHAGFGRRAERMQMPLTAEVAWRARRG